MARTEYITYRQMEDFLRSHGASSTEEAGILSVRHYEKNGVVLSPPPHMDANCDIIVISDDEFIRLCDELPISTFFSGDTSRLTATTMFPPNYQCFVVRHLNSLRVDLHTHDFFEICYAWQGGCTQTTTNQTFEMEAGDFFIIPPGIGHTVKVHSQDTILFNIMVRRDAFLSSCFPLLSQSFAISAFLRHCLLQENPENCLLIHTENCFILKRIVKHLVHECYTMQELFCDFAINIFNQLFCYILLHGEIKAKYLCLPDNFSLIAVLHEIQQNYKTISLKSLSDKFFFSEEHLSRLIRKTTGKTFSELLRETRINQAKTLVARTDLSVEQISEFIGYSDSSSFTKAFKSVLGLSPAQYRKQLRQE